MAINPLAQCYDLGLSLVKKWQNENERADLIKLFLKQVEAMNTIIPSHVSKNCNLQMSFDTFLGVYAWFEREYYNDKYADSFLIRSQDAHTYKRPRLSLSLILDNLRSAHNVGNLFRLADCLGVGKIYLCGYTPRPTESQVQKTALGTESMVTWEWHPTSLELIHSLKRQNIEILAFETCKESLDYRNYQYKENTALLFGNERYGLHKGLLSASHHILEIPVYGKKNSLNVVQAATVAAAFVSNQLRA